jgi:TonB family protein
VIKLVIFASALSLGCAASLQGQVASVVGHLVDSATGAPVVKRWVDVRPLHGGPRNGAWTDPAGTFYIAAAPATDYVVDVSLPDGRKVQRDSLALADFARPLAVAFSDAERRHMYFDFEVDKTAVPVEQPAPRYPKVLEGEGEVLVQVAVDSTGHVDPATFRWLRSPHPTLTAAVQEALMSWRFEPARKAGRPVRQLVQIPFIFHR